MTSTSTTTATAIDAAHALPAPPDWVQGATPAQDAQFLLDTVAALGPATVLELGVAAGVSSAFLLCALDRLPGGGRGRVLRSCDVQPACYFDAARATGEAVASMYPHARAEWILDTNTDARRLSQTLPDASVDLTFIDANHYHPWPLLDLLHLSKAAMPGSWVILHDINLPVIAPQWVASGAQWLFDEWPFEKIAGGGQDRNIGAVRLPADLRRLLPVAQHLIERPWEHAPTMWHVALPEPFAPVQDWIRKQLA